MASLKDVCLKSTYSIEKSTVVLEETKWVTYEVNKKAPEGPIEEESDAPEERPTRTSYNSEGGRSY